jgi:hypothetical protein
MDEEAGRKSEVAALLLHKSRKSGHSIGNIAPAINLTKTGPVVASDNTDGTYRVSLQDLDGTLASVYDHSVARLQPGGGAAAADDGGNSQLPGDDGEQEQIQVTRTALRYTFPQELASLLYAHGFTIIRQYGDWNYEPLTEASPSIIVVCRARASA